MIRAMLKPTLIASVAVAALAGSALAASVSSGFQVGERIVPFHPTFVTGELAGKDACFPCTYKAAPQAQLWVRGHDVEGLKPLFQTLHEAQKENAGFKAMVVLVLPKGEHAKVGELVKGLAKQNEMTDLTFAMLDVQDKYVAANKFNAKAENTLILYRGWTVTNNWVNVKGDKTTVQALEAGIKTLVASPK